MTVRVGRTLPPALAPIQFKSIVRGSLAMFSGDKSTRTFADQLKKHFNVQYCYLLSSGKASLTLILQALKELYPEKDEVLIPAFTCYSVPASIVRAGLKIRICDIEPETLDFDYNELAGHLSSPRLLCVVPTHLFGVTADIPRVREMVGNRAITIVEDAAQAMGGEHCAGMAGTLGDVGFFSLERGKAFSTVEGGIIITNSAQLGSVLKRLSEKIPEYSIREKIVLVVYAFAISVLSRPWLYWLPRSLPFLGLGETIYAPDFLIKRLSSFQAGLATDWQDRLNDIIEIRKKNVEFLTRWGVTASGGSKLLMSGMIRYPVFFTSKSEKMAVLRKSNGLGLGGADVYPSTVDFIDEIRGCLVGGSSVKAQSIVERMVTFPIHPYVTEADLKNITGLIGKAGCNLQKAEKNMQSVGEEG